LAEPLASFDGPVSGEFEREAVPAGARKSSGSFWGMYAGEHTAGTEFLIGPLFLLAWGVGGWSLIAGLLAGNLMAVLTWRFVTAPIAVRVRLTLYAQLERICGRKFVLLYNLMNGLLFCFLAGAMITVSASAFGPLLPGVVMPTFASTMPTGLGWGVIVVLIGAAITYVAAKGYDLVSRVGNLAAPWMFLVFLACGLVVLAKMGAPGLIEALTPVRSDLDVGGFWAVFFFSWLCNAAMHLGMADLSILRFAREERAGWAPAAGMYLGHFVAWLCAALMLAYWVKRMGGDVEAAKAVSLGDMVNDAAGMTGLICVVIAGWTTANPTLYRAGLAFQAMIPGLSRTQATLLAGAICTGAGLFPAFAMQLLGFVGIYGTILAPVGAILFVDFWLAKRVGVVREWAARCGGGFNFAALLAWVLPLLAGAWAYATFPIIQAVPSYLVVPCWLAAGVCYLGFARLLPAPRGAEGNATAGVARV
jgi:nucleobase:cation symporter-1, NCS1 family